MLGLLITIVRLVVDRGGLVISWGGMMHGMVGNNWGMVNSMVSYNWGSMHCMVNRGSMMDSVSTKSCERNGWPTSHQGDKSNQSKDLHDVVVSKDTERMMTKTLPMPLYSSHS